MMGLGYAAWGVFGGFAVEGLEFAAAIRRVGGWPWLQPGEPGPVPLIVSVLIRLTIGAGLAEAAGLTNQVSGPFGALAVGIAAPLLIEQLAGQVPLTLPAQRAGIPLTRDAAATPTSHGQPSMQGGQER